MPIDPGTYQPLAAFRLGDVRGRYPEEVDESFARRFARAFRERFNLTGRVATGRDVRDSSEPLQRALNEALTGCGLDVADLGLCTTELGYFAASRPDIDAAFVITASHNPVHYNGFKCMLGSGEAVTFDSGLSDVMASMSQPEPARAAGKGNIERRDLLPDYLEHVESIFAKELRCGPIALNGLNGCAATLAEAISQAYDLPVTWHRKEPGNLPLQGPDPSNPELVAEMKAFMACGQYTLGVTWDGDCDRCHFFDSEGKPVPTYYIVGLLAEEYLKSDPGAAIVFDTKLCWNTLDVIAKNGGKAIPSQTGHAFMKRSMREHRAIYGGELSSHHFFGDFFHCDSGMFAWLKILEILSRSGRTIDELIRQRRRQFPSIAEVNLKLADTGLAFDTVLDHYRSGAVAIDRFDGLGIEMDGGWRFSLTPSKTEDVVRLNMESRGDAEKLLAQGEQLLRCLASHQNGGDLTETVSIQ